MMMVMIVECGFSTKVVYHQVPTKLGIETEVISSGPSLILGCLTSFRV